MPLASPLIPTVTDVFGTWRCIRLQGGACLIDISTPSGVVRIMVGTKSLVDRGLMTLRKKGRSRRGMSRRGKSGKGLSAG